MSNVIKNIILLGYGNIGQALSHLLRKNFPEMRIDVFDEKNDQEKIEISKKYNFNFKQLKIVKENYKESLNDFINEGSLVLNLATSISSHDLIVFTQEKKAFYLDTCIDPWNYDDGALNGSHNTNYQMRQKVINLIQNQNENSSTAVVAHGANPGFVSILVKKALLSLAKKYLKEFKVPSTKEDWANLASLLDVKVIQISEKDFQTVNLTRDKNEFMNTWSVEGFVAESLQPVELGWGTHEKLGIFNKEAIEHDNGCKSAIYFKNLGYQANIKSWTPSGGDFEGKLISHNEAISIASYLSIKSDDKVIYRPTVYYAYHPCEEGMKSLELLNVGNRSLINKETVLKDEIKSGIDELGVLLISGKYGNLWLGSQLSIERTREISPYNNATSLQVVGSILSAIEWIIQNPNKGILESDDLDYDFIYEKCKFYWEPIIEVYREWYPSNKKDLTLDEFISFQK